VFAPIELPAAEYEALGVEGAVEETPFPVQCLFLWGVEEDPFVVDHLAESYYVFLQTILSPACCFSPCHH